MYICVIDYKFFKLTKQIIMKKKLLYLTSILLFSAAINAQTKVWDLGGNVAPWYTAVSPGSAITSNTVIDNLGLQPQGGTGTANFGILEASVKTFSTTPGYTSVNRFKLNGAGGVLAPLCLPVQRFLYFAAAGSISVEVLFIGGGSGNRTLYVTDGTNVLGSLTATESTTPQILTTNFATVNGNVYIYGDQSCNLYRITVTGPLGTTQLLSSLSNDSFQKESPIVVSARNGKINLSNVKSSTKVSVYNVLGSLVKSIQADADTSLDINSGVYIVKTKSVNGEKSVKVMVQ